MKFNHKLLIIPALAGAVLVTGCGKDYLNTEPSERLSLDQLDKAAKQDPDLTTGLVDGLYTTMYNPGTGGTTTEEDFGQKGVDIYTDLLSGDMAAEGFVWGWYEAVYRFYASLDFTRQNNYIPWRYYYRIIYGANTVLDLLGGSDAVQTEKIKRHQAGQALAMRAYAYFYLSNVYSSGYGDGTQKTIPIYKDAKTPNHPKATAKEVYDLIISDLTKASQYLADFTRASKDKVDANVVKGLLVYTLAARGTDEDLAKVVTLSKELTAAYPKTRPSELAAILDANDNVINPESGFNKVSTPSWIWGVDLKPESGLGLTSWWSMVDKFTYGYASSGDAKPINSDLYDAIGANDVRKKQFDPADLTPINKFYDPERIVDKQSPVVTDYIYMRSDEFHLLAAEANARLNKDVEARADLKNFLSDRMPDVSYIDALSGQALKNEIFLQTRIELWGEGKTMLALKRNKQSIKRGANHIYFAGETYSYNSPELTYPIPRDEVLNNPFLNQ